MHQLPYPPGHLPSKTFGDALEALFAELAAKVKQGQRAPATLAMHQENAGWLKETIAPTTLLAEITDAVVQCVATMEAQGRRRGPGGQARPNTTGTVAKRLCTLKLSLKIARRQGDELVPHWPKNSRATTLRRLGAKLGLLVRRATDFRHTCGTWAAHELRSITVGLKDWMGHSSTELLSTTYAHALPPGLDEVARALSRAARAPKRSPRKVLAGGHGAPRKKNAPIGATNTDRGSDPRDVECVRSKAEI